jgi:hypothetical protein
MELRNLSLPDDSRSLIWNMSPHQDPINTWLQHDSAPPNSDQITGNMNRLSGYSDRKACKTGLPIHQTWYFLLVIQEGSITGAVRSKTRTIFARSNTGIVGTNPARGTDVYVRLFCVCVVLCAGNGLATVWSPVQRVLPTVYRIEKLKKWPRSNKRLYSPREIQEGVAVTRKVKESRWNAAVNQWCFWPQTEQSRKHMQRN